MTKLNLPKLISELCSFPAETQFLEFKHNNCEPERIGRIISGLANSAMLEKERKAYLVWGVEDKTHEVVGTTVRLADHKKGNENFIHWLSTHLDPKIHLEYHSCEIDGKHIELIEIEPGYDRPVRFNGVAYFRINSITKKLLDYPNTERVLWDITNKVDFEDGIARAHMSRDELLQNFDVQSFGAALYSRGLSVDNMILNFKLDGLIYSDNQGGYDVTNLFCICAARNIQNFASVASKSVRVISYKSDNKLFADDDITGRLGYVLGFTKILKFIMDRVGSVEIMTHGVRTTKYNIPEIAIREILANALIHQDLTKRRECPRVEIFTDKVVITNSGSPLISTDRFIDAPPQSRNEKLAQIMRKVGICEMRGSGVDRALLNIEGRSLAPPLFQDVEGSTVVTIYMNKNFNSFTKEDRVRACYQHACLGYVSNNPMGNSSLRERFGLNANQYQQVSSIIRESIADGLIKPLREDQGNKYARYVPIWA